jgi:hypothetical protein
MISLRVHDWCDMTRSLICRMLIDKVINNSKLTHRNCCSVRITEIHRNFNNSMIILNVLNDI